MRILSYFRKSYSGLPDIWQVTECPATRAQGLMIVIPIASITNSVMCHKVPHIVSILNGGYADYLPFSIWVLVLTATCLLQTHMPIGDTPVFDVFQDGCAGTVID